MNLSERNKKIAVSRWGNALKRDLASIRKSKSFLLKKAAICGFLAGDGSVQIRREKTFLHHQVDLFADDSKMLKTYLSFMKEVYNKRPSVTLRDNVHIARISQRFIVIDLLEECAFGLKTWSFPEKLFKIPGARELWLRAFFSAEGYVGKRVIKTQSVNLPGILAVSKLLSRLGIKNNYYEYTPKNKNHSKVGLIFINSKEARLTFFKQVGFWHSRKERKLKESLGL